MKTVVGLAISLTVVQHYYQYLGSIIDNSFLYYALQAVVVFAVSVGWYFIDKYFLKSLQK